MTHGSTPEIRPQYHFRKTEHGLDAWQVARLIELSKDLPVHSVNPSEVAELHTNHWYAHDASVPTPASIIEHAQLIQRCDLSYPIILDSAGRVMDGMHRVCRAFMDGVPEIPAVRFTVDPEPDYVNCSPEDLPYDC